jgi:hypothetical protein
LFLFQIIDVPLVMFSDTDDNVFTVQGDSKNRLVTESGTALHQYRPHLARVRAASPLGDNMPSSISSISPQSDRSSTKSHGKRQSTLLNEPDLDNEQYETLQEEEDFLLQKIISKQGLDFGSKPQNPDLQQLRQTPQVPINKGSFSLSPFGTPAQLEEAANSLVDSMLNSNNNSLIGEDLEQDVPHALYQSLLQTKTPCLPVRSKANRPGVGYNSQQTGTKSRISQDKLTAGTKKLNPVVSSGFKNNSNDEEDELSAVAGDVRVISFQNGSFSEFLDKSPAKTPNKSSARFSKTLGTPTKSQPSPLKVIKDKLDKTTDNLLAQCQELVEKVQSPAKPEFRKRDLPSDHFLTEKEVLRGGAKPRPLPLISETPTVSFMDSYMKTSPPPGKYGNMTMTDDTQSFVVKRFTLDLDSDEEESVSQGKSTYTSGAPASKDQSYQSLSPRRTTGILRTSQKPTLTHDHHAQQQHIGNEQEILNESSQFIAADDLDLMMMNLNPRWAPKSTGWF